MSLIKILSYSHGAQGDAPGEPQRHHISALDAISYLERRAEASVVLLARQRLLDLSANARNGADLRACTYASTGRP